MGIGSKLKKAVKKITKAVTKPVTSAAKGLVGEYSKLKTPEIQIPEAPDYAALIKAATPQTPQELAEKGPEPVDAQALIAAKERIEQEKKRKGRRSLRVDLAISEVGSGSGVAVPK